jgi:putative ABC transport system permease protein
VRYLPLVWHNLMRRRARTLFTVLSIVVAFLLFAYLAALRLAFSLGVELTGNDRLVLIHKVSLVQLLPESYQARLEAAPGVIEAAHATWFGGIYQDSRNFFPQMAVEPERWLRMFPEFRLTEAEREAWLSNRSGAIAGRSLANRFGWNVGDRIPIQGTIWRQATTSTWEFTLEGIYDGAEKGTDTSQFFFHYEYLDQARQFGEGMVGWYTLRIDDPERAPEIAGRIDAMFANSSYETKTTTEKAFAQAFANQIGDIGLILTSILGAVFFTILLVTANTMAQSVRERTSELAVMKTLGFSNTKVMSLVLLESCAIAGAGGLLGLALGWWLIETGGDPTGGFLAAFYVPARDILLGVVIVAVLGLATGLPPAVQAMRLRIVDALRRT